MESPRGTRILQIVLGGIAIALSLGVILNPGFGIATLILLLSATLLVVGIERVVRFYKIASIITVIQVW
jgi:uncharacterized membrane protein HdeD (DUF308 family)